MTLYACETTSSAEGSCRYLSGLLIPVAISKPHTASIRWLLPIGINYTANNSGKKKMSLKGMCMHHRTQKAYPHWSYATDLARPTCEKWDDL